MIKKVIGLFSLVIFTTLVIGFYASTDFIVEREVTINRSKDLVFDNLKYIKNHEKWNPWSKRDPAIRREYRGTDGTIGFVSSWSGNNDVGSGEEEIKNIINGEKIETELRFKKPIEERSRAYFVVESLGDKQSRVKWGVRGETPFPANVVCFILNLRGKFSKDFDEGLTNLKTILETSSRS